MKRWYIYILLRRNIREPLWIFFFFLNVHTSIHSSIVVVVIIIIIIIDFRRRRCKKDDDGPGLFFFFFNAFFFSNRFNDRNSGVWCTTRDRRIYYNVEWTGVVKMSFEKCLYSIPFRPINVRARGRRTPFSFGLWQPRCGAHVFILYRWDNVVSTKKNTGRLLLLIIHARVRCVLFDCYYVRFGRD